MQKHFRPVYHLGPQSIYSGYGRLTGALRLKSRARGHAHEKTLGERCDLFGRQARSEVKVEANDPQEEELKLQDTLPKATLLLLAQLGLPTGARSWLFVRRTSRILRGMSTTLQAKKAAATATTLASSCSRERNMKKSCR